MQGTTHVDLGLVDWQVVQRFQWIVCQWMTELLLGLFCHFIAAQ